MKKRGGSVYFFGAILSIFLLSLVGATYNFSNFSIQDTYSKGSSISGSLKISFTNEPINSLFTDSLGNSVELRDLISSSPSYSHTCGYSNCESKFTSVSSGPTFTFSLPNTTSAYYGIVFNENLVKINSVRFELVSDAPESEENQISIDLFGDDEIEIKNTKVGTNFGEENLGCFNSSHSQTEITITTTPYCQKVSLYESPGLKMGAWVKETSSGIKNITMSLYKENGVIVNSCNLPKNSMSSSGGRVFCTIDSPVEEKDYYVCVGAGTFGGGDYKTRGYSQSPNCGFQGIPPKSPVYTYELIVSERNFGSVGTLNIENNFSSGSNLSTRIENYIVSKYGSKDCFTESCFVPIKIISSKDQSVTLKNLNVNYDFQGGQGAVTNTLHKFEEDPSKINSTTGNLLLGNFFKLPDEEQNLTYTLNYNGEELFEEDISIMDFGINVYPLKSAAGFPTNFLAIVPSDLDVTLYSWNFGDNISTTSLVPNVRHTYLDKGNFTLSLKISSDIGEISSTFTVQVGSPEEVLTEEIQNRKERLEEFETKVVSLNAFEKKEVDKLVNVSFLRSELASIEEENSLASTDEEYTYIVSRLLNLSFPVSLEKSSVSQSFFIPTESSINLDALSSITGKTYNDSQESYDYIRFWNVDKLDSDLSEKEIVIEWDEKPKSVIRFFDLVISQSKPVSEDYYFVIKDSSELSFENEAEVSNGTESYKSVKISTPNKRIYFSMTGTESPLGTMFISPALINTEEIGEIEETKNNLLIVVLGIFGVLLIGLLVYLVLHRWYKLKYENYLFPDKNHLYNAIFYINNSVKNGMEEYEIRKNLLNAGWKGEQVSYLMKKYAGKRTGMVDIFGFMKSDETIKSSSGFPPKPGYNSEYQERGRNTKFNK
ncbi:MAG: PKD domain-containing protein [Nanoarchaeota archaeon]|nr:PKD domain-containing protein [Nanoarchaeota archaeon]